MRSKIVVIGLLFAGSVVGSATFTALRPTDALADGGVKKKRAQTRQARGQEYLQEAGMALPIYVEGDFTATTLQPDWGGGDPLSAQGCKRKVTLKKLTAKNEKCIKTALLEGGVGGEGALLCLGNGQKNVDKRATVVLDGRGVRSGGQLSLFNSPGNESIILAADTGEGAEMYLRDNNGVVTVELTAHRPGPGGGLFRLLTAKSFESVRLQAESPDGPLGMLRVGRIQEQRIDVSGGIQGETAPNIGIHAWDNEREISGIVLNGGGSETGSFIHLRNLTNPTVILNGKTGDGTFAGQVEAKCFKGDGCDLAETFDLSDRERVEPGVVMAMDPQRPGFLNLSTRAYDRKVAGIVSGAGDLRPGMMLGKRADGSSDLPIALSGRVYCYVDATEQAVEVGDLLTSSNTPGYAMKAVDHGRAFGAVLGKAMQPLAKGKKGLVLVLVALQ